MPNRSGEHDGEEYVRDWMVGGVARRKILERLAEPGDGWTGRELEEDLGLGRAWVFEVLRALKTTTAIEPVPGRRGSYRLAEGDPLGTSLREVLRALEPYADTTVSRPPSRRARPSSQ